MSLFLSGCSGSWASSERRDPRQSASAPEYAGRDQAEHLSMKNDRWKSRSGFPVPAPIATGGGTGGRQAPRQGLIGFPELSPSRCEETIERMAQSASARGLRPRTPACDWPGCTGKGRAVWSSMKNSGWSCRRVLRVPAPITFGGGVGGQQAPRLVSARAFWNPHAFSARMWESL